MIVFPSELGPSAPSSVSMKIDRLCVFALCRRASFVCERPARGIDYGIPFGSRCNEMATTNIEGKGRFI